MALLDGITAVIFDLDGTLLDTMGLWNEVDAELARRLGAPQLADDEVHVRREKILTAAINNPDPYLTYCEVFGQMCGSTLPAKDIHAMRYSISRELMQSMAKPRSGIPELIQALKDRNLMLAIATTTKKRNITVYAEQNPYTKVLDFYNTFLSILTVEDVAAAKPAPDLFLKSAQMLHTAPQQCLVVEDSLQGVQAGLAAQMHVVCVREKHAENHASELKRLAHYYFNDFTEMKKALQ